MINRMLLGLLNVMGIGVLIHSHAIFESHRTASAVWMLIGIATVVASFALPASAPQEMKNNG